VGANPPTDKAPDNAFPGKGKIIVQLYRLNRRGWSTPSARA
jgi:hypothetical protein